MRINRFFIDSEFDLGDVEISDKGFSHQLKNVLRLVPGEKVILFNGNGKEAISEMVGFYKNKVLVKILDVIEVNREPKNKITLYCSLLKGRGGKRFETVIEKAAEIGVVRIVPIICARTVKKKIRRERLKKITKEAAEQAGRVTIPLIDEEIKFEKAVISAKNDLNLFFDPRGEKVTDFKTGISGKKIGVWIGPEGGWSEEEIQKAKIANFKILSLSELIFRAETAAIIGCFLASL